MDGQAEKYAAKLLENSNKKYSLLRDMLDLTKAQSQTLKEDGLDTLEKLINQKQSRIEDINRIDEEFNLYFQRFKHELGISSLDELKNPADIEGIAGLKEIVGKIMVLLKEIDEIEKKNNEKAKILLSDFANEIKKVNMGKKMNSAYAQKSGMQPPSYFIDKKK